MSPCLELRCFPLQQATFPSSQIPPSVVMDDVQAARAAPGAALLELGVAVLPNPLRQRQIRQAGPRAPASRPPHHGRPSSSSRWPPPSRSSSSLSSATASRSTLPQNCKIGTV
ncbi:hypothetical protein VPH35_129788 [Triticum aestivum]